MRQPYKRSFSALLSAAITIFALLCLGCNKQEPPTYAGPPTKMIIGIFKGESTAILYVADHLGYLKQMGIEAELREFDSGAAAAAALNEGSVNLATASDFAFAGSIDKHPDLRIVASVNKMNDLFLVARKDRGINKSADLKGKRIAVTQTSVGEYFLEKHLYSNRLKPEDVTVIYMTPTMMEKEILTGSVDAALVWDPVARRMKESLETNGICWPVQVDSSYHMLLIARDSFINKESAAMARLMKGLIAAEESIAKDPAPIQRYLSKRFGMPEKYYFDIWGDNQFKVSIDRSLMLSLEEQSRWIRKSKGTADRKLPNHFNSFYLDSLKSARPESVSIVY